MKKFFLLIMASMMAVSMMAVGTGDGSSKANAIEFDWDKANPHAAGTKWYHVDLTPLYQEENPSLTLYVTNPSHDKSIEVSMTATVAGETETKHYTLSPHEHQIYSANATMLVQLHQTEIYLTLTTDGEVLMSAKVFEASDLDETCKNAKELKWDTEMTQTEGYAAWWKVDLRGIKDTVNYPTKDACVTITNAGTKTVNLKTGQSLDCPSSGLTKRNYTLAAGESIVDTIPQSMILSVYPDELYFSIENLEAPVKMKVEMVERPIVPVISDTETFKELHVTDTIEPLAAKTYYRIKVADMDSMAKYEPEFTYRNVGTTPAKVTIKMAFEVPAYGTSNTTYELAPGEEQIVVYKKNMLDGIQGAEYIYLLTEVTGDVNFYGRFKHVREGKACKTNIDFNWETGHTQEARTTQWYAINVADARDDIRDIVVHLINQGTDAASVKASLAFSCPYIDVQELTRTIAADGQEFTRTLGYSMYSMLTDTVWLGLETSEDLKFWATTKPAQTNEPDKACEKAEIFNWDDGVVLKKDTTVWYKINMEEVRKKAAKFPTVFVQNLSTDAAANITAELSVECPDSIENQKRSTTIAANGIYTKQLSRNLFENIVQDEIYLCVRSTQDISIQIRLTEEAAGTSCSSAIPFNWASGNTQAANANLWYVVDLQPIIESGEDLKLHLQNRDNAECTGFIQVAYSCPLEDATTLQNYKLAANAQKDAIIRNSAIESMTDGVVYVNIQGSTSLRFWADKITPDLFDTIYASEIDHIDTLYWDSIYTQTKDTAWYIIPQSQIDYVRNIEEKVTPVAHLIDASNSAKTITAEAAFAFPINKTMMSKTKELKANQHFSDTIPVGTFDQVLKKNSIIIRVIRKSGTGDFRFGAKLVKAYSGNEPKDARPIRMNALYTQSPNTEMWYKVKTADLKKQKDLYNKVMYVIGKNAGMGAAKVKVAVYDGYKAKYEKEDDLLMDRGERTFKKGETKSHNVPAQAVYGIGDVELYIKIRTTDSLVFETKFNGEYAPIAPDAAQQKAQLLVPNVQYTLPGDNKPHWYQVCIPYIQNNYIYVDGSTLEYELNGETTIEATATFQDTMTCAMPVRKRKINKSGTYYHGSKTIRELIDRAITRAGYKYDISSTAPEYIDSLLHRFITKDSVTLYVRLKSDKDITLRLNTPQTTGNACTNAMAFDWEHGNVNPKGNTTWYMVKLNPTLIPDTCDLRLHVKNWSNVEASATAGLRFKCEEEPMVTVTKTVPANDERTQDIDRDLLDNMGWPSNMLIEYFSNQSTHIWMELIPNTPRETIRETVTIYACQGTDTLVDGINHTIDSTDVSSLTWETVFELKDNIKAAMYDSIVTYEAVVLIDPKFPTFEEFADLPVIKRGSAIDVTAADTWLKTYLATAKTDMIKAVKAIAWQYSTDGVNFAAVDATPLSTERVNIKYVVDLQCDDRFDDDLYKNIVRDTTYVTACNSYEWVISAAETKKYITDTIDSVVIIDTYLGDSIAYLNLTVNNPFQADLELVHKFGNRLLMVNRNDINSIPGWENILDSLDNGAGYVKWYKKATPADELVGTGYYYALASGEPLPAGDTYYAVLDIPATTGTCGLKGETEHYTIPVGAGAPALMPSLAKPSENIQIINLNPEVETTIRLYTSEGLLQATYRVAGQETYTIKAAEARGFYMVELSNDEIQSTLRYIVK